MVYITLKSSQQFFERVQEKIKIESNLYRLKNHNYGIIKYDPINDFYIVLNKNINVVYDSRVSNLDIEKYIEYTEVNDNEFSILSNYRTDRMIEPSKIKHNKIMFYLDEFLKFKRITKPFSFYKSY